MSGSADVDLVPAAMAPPAPTESNKPSPAAKGRTAPEAARGGEAGAVQGAKGGAAGRRKSVPVSAAVAAPPDRAVYNSMYVPPVASGNLKPAVSTTPLVNFLIQLKNYTPTIPDAMTGRLGVLDSHGDRAGTPPLGHGGERRGQGGPSGAPSAARGHPGTTGLVRWACIVPVPRPRACRPPRQPLNSSLRGGGLAWGPLPGWWPTVARHISSTAVHRGWLQVDWEGDLRARSAG
ncbi:uncharacterized protein LOC114056041 [Empidonax traillii]|uniref:uncharacterized protein LOC114056041 n=1 Tax=Empidonax traillii TaxID=164674 RepID=UPI000FFD8B87|nr:uncharacterized protein LOC114056041 [Empidonax traillii]